MGKVLIAVLQAFWIVVGLLAAVSAIGIALGGCTVPMEGASETIEPLPVYQEPVLRASLKVQADGLTYAGTASLKRVTSRKIAIEVPRDTYQLGIVNCAGEQIIPYPPAGWYTFDYAPLMGLENFDSCAMVATALTTRGEIYKAIVDFADGHELPALLVCNRDRLKTVGAALCQSRASHTSAGLTQRIDFDVPTIVVASTGCAEPRVSDWIRTYYEIDMQPGFCVYKFQDEQKRIFRLTTYGYTDIRHIVPGGNK